MFNIRQSVFVCFFSVSVQAANFHFGASLLKSVVFVCFFSFDGTGTGQHRKLDEATLKTMHYAHPNTEPSALRYRTDSGGSAVRDVPGHFPAHCGLHTPPLTLPYLRCGRQLWQTATISTSVFFAEAFFLAPVMHNRSMTEAEATLCFVLMHFVRCLG